MKKIILGSLSATVLIFSGCATNQPSTPSNSSNNDVMSIDVSKVCSVKDNGIEKVLATAKKYNSIAIKKGVEFKRLGVKNSSAIKALDEAIKSGKQTITVIGKKKKKQTFKVDYATQRACKFAIRALQEDIEAQEAYHYAIPGDKFQY